MQFHIRNKAVFPSMLQTNFANQCCASLSVVDMIDEYWKLWRYLTIYRESAQVGRGGVHSCMAFAYSSFTVSKKLYDARYCILTEVGNGCGRNGWLTKSALSIGSLVRRIRRPIHSPCMRGFTISAASPTDTRDKAKISLSSGWKRTANISPFIPFSLQKYMKSNR